MPTHFAIHLFQFLRPISADFFCSLASRSMPHHQRPPEFEAPDRARRPVSHRDPLDLEPNRAPCDQDDGRCRRRVRSAALRSTGTQMEGL